MGALIVCFIIIGGIVLWVMLAKPENTTNKTEQEDNNKVSTLDNQFDNCKEDLINLYNDISTEVKGESFELLSEEDQQKIISDLRYIMDYNHIGYNIESIKQSLLRDELKQLVLSKTLFKDSKLLYQNMYDYNNALYFYNSTGLKYFTCYFDIKTVYNKADIIAIDYTLDNDEIIEHDNHITSYANIGSCVPNGLNMIIPYENNIKSYQTIHATKGLLFIKTTDGIKIQYCDDIKNIYTVVKLWLI